MRKQANQQVESRAQKRNKKKKKSRIKRFLRLCVLLVLGSAGALLVKDSPYADVIQAQIKTMFTYQEDGRLEESLAETIASLEHSITEMTSETTSESSAEIEKPSKPLPLGHPQTNERPIHSFADFNQQVTSHASKPFEEILEENNFIGTALIVKDANILLQKGYGFADKKEQKENTVQSTYQIGSIQKSMTGIMIAKLIEERKLSFHTTLDQFYPDVPGSDFITIKQLLNMTSGLEATDQPRGLYDETEIVNFYRQHLRLTVNGKYSYQPINYNLLAGIVIKLTQKDYFTNFQEVIGKPTGMIAGTYKDWYDLATHTTSYAQIDGKDYQKVIRPKEDIFAREIGTGNIDCSPASLYWMFHEVFAGKVLSHEMLDQLYYNPIGSERYQGGLTNRQDYFRSNGIIRGQRAMLLMTPNAKDAVILMSNENLGDSQSHLIELLYHQLMGYEVSF